MCTGFLPDNIRFRLLVLLKVALQKIPSMALATIMLISRQNQCFLRLYCTLTIHSLLYLPQFCSVQTWRNTYSTNFHPIVFGPHVLPPPELTDSEEELPCHAPHTRILRGRPKKERYRRGEARQHAPRAQEHLCSTCGQPAHMLGPS